MGELAKQGVDLTNCDREPIHIPGAIQPHGVLLATDVSTLAIMQLGGDTERLLGLRPSELLGHGLDIFIDEATLKMVREIGAGEFALPRHSFAFETRVEHGGRPFDAVVHQSDGMLVLELEPRPAGPPINALARVQTMMTRVQDAPDMSGFLQAATEAVRSETGFDRVMVYRLQPDDSGVVIAEAKAEELEPYLGQHYPASDIPKQARDLYLRNRIRSIPDARYTPVPITPPLNSVTGKPLDLTFSTLRSVSPIHLEYLANMGVVSSTSLSLVIDGKLWGLISCHHRTPKYLCQDVRGMCEMFAQTISLQLGEKLANEAQGERLRLRRIQAQLVEAIVGQDRLDEALIRNGPRLLEYIPAGGLTVSWEGKLRSLGQTPTEEQLRPLLAWLNASVPEGVFMTDSLAAHFAPARDYAGVASGLLALSVSRTPRDYVLWFRPELCRVVTWAGNPVKPVEIADDGVRIGPRKSFAAWQETVREHSRPWGEHAAEAVELLRGSIFEVVLRHLDEVMQRREKVRRHQDFLMAELDHRVKNTIAVIQALVKRSSAEATSLEDYRESILARLYAMGRTHSLLTQSRWEGINLQDIVAEQSEAFGERMTTAGPKLVLRPKAALSVSLALHELMTNAAKYGSLSVAMGRVEVGWSVESREDGRCLIFRWAESGGPPVVPPARMGFGRVLLERSLAYDIDGEVDLDFRAEGVICTATIPFDHVIKEE
jgi:light-regulated signal transduction histidine kinase (bacteriophytochrome)